MDAAARRWCAAVETASRFGERHPISYLRVHYEVLVKKPEETVKSICSFLRIQYDNRMLSNARPT
jgi:hypothetical protein